MGELLAVQNPGAVGHRFIPACVGNSPPTSRWSWWFPVHPRVCGELSPVGRTAQQQAGSSPRVWGTPRIFQCQIFHCRFIPACVGNSPVAGCHRRCSSVHPRVCGELPGLRGLLTWDGGSSPRVWGTPASLAPRPGCSRFIPACVGNSHSTMWVYCTSTVQPRVCGELPRASRRAHAHSGPSPRVWGTPAPAGPHHRPGRFIPACVGNSSHRMSCGGAETVHPRGVWGTRQR